MKFLIGLLLIVSFKPAMADVEEYGNILHLLLPATAAGLTYFMEDDFDGTIQLAKAGVTSRAIVETGKFLIHKDRPDDSGDDSFMSGHTADSFAAATFINNRYGQHLGLPAFLTAAYVGYTRMEADKHFFEDVVLGGLTGIISAIYFTDPYTPEDDVKVGFFSNEQAGRGIYIAASF